MSGAPNVRSVSPSSSFFPVFLRLTGRRVLLVGAGPVGASKLQGLLDAGALITVVAPDIVPDIEQAAVRHADAITLQKRAFEVSDLDGVWYVVAAATPAVNRAVAQAAEARQLFVNAVDDPPNATAYLGGVLRRGGVTVAISTDGHAPALAGLLREGLDALLPQELDEWLDEARAVRKKWLADGVPMEERRPLLLQTLNDIYRRRAATTSTVTAKNAETEVHA
jgi:uroporphyrin-III C-methyltransferase / precorrin-2 dehydrogenase / sirohydrochlorin ferrochelatase